MWSILEWFWKYWSVWHTGCVVASIGCKRQHVEWVNAVRDWCIEGTRTHRSKHRWFGKSQCTKPVQPHGTDQKCFWYSPTTSLSCNLYSHWRLFDQCTGYSQLHHTQHHTDVRVVESCLNIPHQLQQSHTAHSWRPCFDIWHHGGSQHCYCSYIEFRHPGTSGVWWLGKNYTCSQCRSQPCLADFFSTNQRHTWYHCT